MYFLYYVCVEQVFIKYMVRHIYNTHNKHVAQCTLIHNFLLCYQPRTFVIKNSRNNCLWLCFSYIIPTAFVPCVFGVLCVVCTLCFSFSWLMDLATRGKIRSTRKKKGKTSVQINHTIFVSLVGSCTSHAFTKCSVPVISCNMYSIAS